MRQNCICCCEEKHCVCGMWQVAKNCGCCGDEQLLLTWRLWLEGQGRFAIVVIRNWAVVVGVMNSCCWRGVCGWRGEEDLQLLWSGTELWFLGWLTTVADNIKRKSCVLMWLLRAVVVFCFWISTLNHAPAFVLFLWRDLWFFSSGSVRLSARDVVVGEGTFGAWIVALWPMMSALPLFTLTLQSFP